MSERAAGQGMLKRLGARGFEPRTSPLSGVRSSHLSYAPCLLRPDHSKRAPIPESTVGTKCCFHGGAQPR